MIKFYIILSLVLMSCNNKKNNKKLSNKSEHEIKQVIKAQDSLSFEDLMFLNKHKAILKYGNPVSSERFVLDDAQGEFRNSISDVFSIEERQRNSILIEEVTWEKDSRTWITVWYQLIEKKVIPKSVFSWKKGSEF